MTSIRLKSLLYKNLIQLIFIPFLILILVVMAFYSSDIRESITNKNRDILSTLRTEISTDLQGSLNQLLMVRDAYLSPSILRNGGMDALLQTVVNNHPSFESISIIDPAGQVINIGLPARLKTDNKKFLGRNLSQQEFFQQVRRTGQPFWSDTFLSTHTGTPAITLAVPAGKAVVVGNLNLNHLNVLTSSVGWVLQSSIAILNKHGQVIGHTSSNYVSQRANFSDLDIVRHSMRGNQGSYRFAFQGREWIGSITTIPETSWMVMVSQDAGIAYKPVYRLGIIFLAGLILALAIVMITASCSITRILIPLSMLTESTRAIAAGQHKDFKPPYSIHEIDELGKNFSSMAVAIQTREFELHERNDELMSLEEELRQQLDENFMHQLELISAAKRLEMILSSIDDGFYAVNSEGQITYFNGIAEKLFGCQSSSVLGKQIWEVLPNLVDSVFQLKYVEAMATHQPVSFTAYFAPAQIWLESRYYPFEDGLTVFFRDISEVRAYEERLLHAHRMESIGTLAGGIAHDFNNILTVIIGCSNMAQRYLENNQEAEHFVGQVVEAANRAAGLTNNLLAFSRKQVIEIAVVDLNSIITHLEKMLSRVIREDIHLKFDLHDTPLHIMADAGQLEQVVINLAANARDAMPDGGELHVSTRKETALLLSTKSNEPTESLCAVLEVTDTGTGMEEQTMERIFDPFYTTKEIGKGTGLGLSMAYGIISQHQGRIDVSSKPGRGTTFTIYLPLTTAKNQKQVLAKKYMTLKGNETILLAEDDSFVREATSNILEYAGYHVINAVNGQEAISCFDQVGKTVDLVLMDVIMPVMNGMDAYTHIRSLRPDVRIIFTSGYPSDILQKEGVDSEGIRLLQKPVSPDILLAAVREALDAPAVSRIATHERSGKHHA